MIGIEQHAVLYALFAKEIFKYLKEKDAESLIEKATFRYGYSRGERMRKVTLSNGYPLNMNSFFLFGEWKGRPGENLSSLQQMAEATESHVTKCAWYDAWKKHGLTRYGCYYCRYIDQGICAGYRGEFSLAVPSAIGLGDEKCIFHWTQSYDPVQLEKDRSVTGESNIKPFSFHCRDLYDCFAGFLDAYPDKKEQILHSVMESFRSLFPDESDF